MDHQLEFVYIKRYKMNVDVKTWLAEWFKENTDLEEGEIGVHDNYFEKGVQAFIEFVRSDVFLKHIKSMVGYDCRSTGKVMYSTGEIDEQ